VFRDSNGHFVVVLFFQTYSMSVYLVRQLTSPLLLQRLRMKGIRNPDHSRALSNSTVDREEFSSLSGLFFMTPPPLLPPLPSL